MLRPGTRGALAIAGCLGLIAAVAPGLRLRGEPRVLHRGAGVTLERVDEELVPHGDRLGADEGDLLLSNGALQLVVGASTEPGERFEHGAILDVTGPGWTDDALESMRVVVQVGGRRVPLVTERVEPLPGKGAPAIRIVQRDGASTLALVTDVSMQARRDTIDVVTRLTNRGRAPLTVRVGDDVAWPGVATFAPGHGDVEEPGRKFLSWIGRRGPLTYGLVFPGAPVEVEFRAKQSETDQTCWGLATEVAAGGNVTHRRVLVATRRGFSEVAKVAATVTGVPVGRVTGVLRPAPPWAIFTAIASDGTIAMKDGVREDGSYELALPPGRYTVVLQSPGGWDETQVLVSAGDEPTRASLVAPQAERLDFRITDLEGRPIPGRLVIVGLDGTSDPRFASAPRVSAAGNEVHTVTGEGQVDLPPGRYRVTVSRGIEWSLVERTIDVKPEQGVALRVALAHDVSTPGWISADLHLHAKPSGDSELPLDDRIASLVSAGVEFAVATDHNHVTDYGPTLDALDAHPLLAAARGVEVTTRTWGHFNAYPLPAGAPPPPFSAVDPEEIFAGVRKIAPDAVIQVNHPWRPGYGYFHRAALNERTGAHWRKQFSFDFDLIEVVNGYELGGAELPDKNLHRYFDLLGLGRRYTAVGSSDSHKLTNEWAGYPRTYVRVADDRPGHVTAEELAASLRAGHATVSLGPIVDAHVGESGPGDTVQTSPGTLPLAVTVRSASFIDVSGIDIVLSGETIDSLDLRDSTRRGGVRWTRTIDVPITRDGWIAVVVHGERPMDEVLPGLHVLPFAFTNPIWVDVGAPPSGQPHHVTHSGRGGRMRRPPRPEPFPVIDESSEEPGDAAPPSEPEEPSPDLDAGHGATDAGATP